MFILDDKIGIFKIRQVWFAESPIDVKGFDRVMFYFCTNQIPKVPKGFMFGNTHLNIIDLTRPLESILGSMQKRTRQYISYAERNGYEKNVCFNEHYDKYVTMQNRFFKEKKILLPTHITEHQLKQSEHMLASAIINNQIICAHYMIINKDFITMLFSSDIRSAKPELSKEIGIYSRYLYWLIIQKAKEEKLKQMAFGSVSTNAATSNITKFKLDFGGAEIDVPTYEKVYSPLYKMADFGRKKIFRG